MSDFVEGDPYDPLQAETVEQLQAKRVSEADGASRELVERRRAAYVRVFAGATDYDRKVVLDDLARFCRGNETPWHHDERLHCLLTGRHEVYSRIDQHLTLTTDQLLEKLT